MAVFEQKDVLEARMVTVESEVLFVPDVGGDDFEIRATAEKDAASVWTSIEVRKSRHGENPETIARFDISTELFRFWAERVMAANAKADAEGPVR